MVFGRRARELGSPSPQRVCVTGAVVVSRPTTSPFTGLEAAVMVWETFVNHKPTFEAPTLELFDREVTPSLARVDTIVRARDLRIDVDGALVAIPLEAVKVRFAGRPAPVPVDCPWPADLPRPPDHRGFLYYVERRLLLGEELELTATVEPVARDAGVYRGSGAPRVDYLARGDLEPVVLRELSPSL